MPPSSRLRRRILPTWARHGSAVITTDSRLKICGRTLAEGSRRRAKVGRSFAGGDRAAGNSVPAAARSGDLALVPAVAVDEVAPFAASVLTALASPESPAGFRASAPQGIRRI